LVVYNIKHKTNIRGSYKDSVMYTIPFITTDEKLFANIVEQVKECKEETVQVIQINNTEQAVEYLNIEMPELVFINFSDEGFDAFALLHTIMKDPWLLHGGIIAFCKDFDTMQKVEDIRGANIIVDLPHDELSDNFAKILSIIFKNRRILFQREIGSDIVKNISGSFKLDNDPLEVKCYVNLICNFLYNSNKLDVDKKFNLQLAINEMLLNAIEHGNCKIDYNEKSAWLEKHGTIDGLIKKRAEEPGIADKKVTFEYTITPISANFFIADEGDGFDWRKIQDARKAENLLKLHGRGILLTKNVVQNLSYNEKGNEVSFEIGYEAPETAIMPGLFYNLQSVDTKSGDIIFKKGEPSNYLFYIVKGKYDVIVNDNVVSTLTADDIFVGEMSFLLNNQRSATVTAETDGKLIKISKKEFVEAIKQKPHYALFLSRLLAQRIQRQNERK